MSLISQYDAFIGRLLRVIYIRNPEILNGSDKQLTYQLLSQFSTLEDARMYIIDREIEATLRSSHSEQMKCMERQFGLPLTKGLASWPCFIEATERRNLFVHTDGIVSAQYLSVCRSHGCLVEPCLREGQVLDVTPDYFATAHDCLFEVGVKLGHVLWRKLFPTERMTADNALNATCYDLLCHERHDLAIRILDCALHDFHDFADEAHRLRLLVNLAQAHKWSGQPAAAAELLGTVDWSAKGEDFRLANAVLTEDWEQARSTMRRIGPDGPVKRTDYRDWPLFRDFRGTQQFLAEYEAVFGEPFAATTVVAEQPRGSGDGDLDRGSEPPDCLAEQL